jgi:hypothetical protein
MLTAFMIVPPGLRPREVLGVVSPVTRGIDDEPREDCFPPIAAVRPDLSQWLLPTLLGPCWRQTLQDTLSGA